MLGLLLCVVLFPWSEYFLHHCSGSLFICVTLSLGDLKVQWSIFTPISLVESSFCVNSNHPSVLQPLNFIFVFFTSYSYDHLVPQTPLSLLFWSLKEETTRPWKGKDDAPQLKVQVGALIQTSGNSWNGSTVCYSKSLNRLQHAVHLLKYFILLHHISEWKTVLLTAQYLFNR